MPFLREKTGQWSPEKIAALAIVLAPALWLLWLTATGNLGARPFAEATWFTGRWTVRLILAALAVTPARRLFNWPKLLNMRRTLGVGAACFAFAHFCLYVVDQQFVFTKVASEIVLRVYLTIGFTALVGLLVLGATSTDAAVRRLGARWTTLHRLSYLIGILAITHFAMQKKLDIYEPTLMMGFLFWLLLWRVFNRYWRATGVLPLITLAVVTAALTAIFEATWYGFLTGVEFRRVLEANISFDFRISPMWWVLAAALAVTAASLIAQWLWPRPRGERSERPRGQDKESARAKLRPAES